MGVIPFVIKGIFYGGLKATIPYLFFSHIQMNNVVCPVRLLQYAKRFLMFISGVAMFRAFIFLFSGLISTIITGYISVPNKQLVALGVLVLSLRIFNIEHCDA